MPFKNVGWKHYLLPYSRKNDIFEDAGDLFLQPG